MATLTKICTDFEKRLARLETSQRTRAWTLGVSGCMIANTEDTRNPTEEGIRQSYTMTKNTFIRSSYIANLLQMKADPSQQVTSGYLHLYAVIKFIKDASTEINPRTGLTNQEEVLLKMLSSVQNCGTGKSEGLAEFYSTLPADARFHGIAEGEKKSDKAKQYLAKVAQSVLAKYLEDLGPMAKELIGREDDSQWVHTRKYLKNLIAKRVGLDWDIAYDAYPGCVDDTLKGRSLEEVLKIFYKHITPDNFLRDIYIKVKADIVPNSEEIQKIEDRLKLAMAELKAKENQGQMPALQKRQGELLGAKFAKQMDARQKAQALRALKESETPVESLALRNAECAAEHAKQAWEAWQAENKSVSDQLESEKKRLGIPALEQRVEEIEAELDGPLEKVNQPLVDQLTDLLGGLTKCQIDSFEDCMESVASTGFKNTITVKGLVYALIEAGYFAKV